MIALQHIEPGRRLRLKSGAIVEVVENPRDGQWLVVRTIGADGTAGAGSDLVHADDVSDEFEERP